MYAAILCLAVAAPAPLPKTPAPTPATPVDGAWKMTWVSTDCQVTFAPGGAYKCKLGSSSWVGHWTYDQKTCRITVHEKPEGGALSPVTWEVTLRTCMSAEGVYSGRPVTVRLERVD